jgi:hypothetical protein
VNTRPAARMNQDFAVASIALWRVINSDRVVNHDGSRESRDLPIFRDTITPFLLQRTSIMKAVWHLALHRRIVVERPMLFIKSCPRA